MDDHISINLRHITSFDVKLGVETKIIKNFRFSGYASLHVLKAF